MVKQQSMNNLEIDDEVENSNLREELDESSSDSSEDALYDDVLSSGMFASGETNVLQWLLALDLQVMGACRVDERLKPLLKLNVSAGAAEDRLLAHLSQVRCKFSTNFSLIKSMMNSFRPSC